MRNRYVIANWKMNLPPEGVDAYLEAMKRNEGVVVAPPFPYIERVARSIATGGQNCGDQKSGAFTGEVSVDMLRDSGAGFVIIGHSERRNVYGESDAMIARKLALVIEAGMTPVLCIGEDLLVRDSGGCAMFLADQIRAVAVPQLESAAEVVIAYEPIWAIGTGRNASGAMVAESVNDIRGALGRFWPARHRHAAPILYGGSVTPDNIADLAANGGIDGYLVGGASLDSGKFLAIVRGAR